MRKITVIVNNTNEKKIIESNAVTLGELKNELHANGINTENQTFFEGFSRTELKDDQSVLPTNIPYKGKTVNDLVIMMTTENKKISSGLRDRKELYAEIKDKNLQDDIKNSFGKSYTNVSTADLEEFLADYTDDDEDDDCNDDCDDNDDDKRPAVVDDFYYTAACVVVGMEEIGNLLRHIATDIKKFIAKDKYEDFERHLEKACCRKLADKLEARDEEDEDLKLFDFLK